MTKAMEYELRELACLPDGLSLLEICHRVNIALLYAQDAWKKRDAYEAERHSRFAADLMANYRERRKQEAS